MDRAKQRDNGLTSSSSMEKGSFPPYTLSWLWRHQNGSSSISHRVCPIPHLYGVAFWLSGVSVPLLEELQWIRTTSHALDSPVGPWRGREDVG